MNTDTLYYIMDYKCNYYQVDKNDQLVAVGYDYEATLFTFAQANSRIGVGRKASSYDLSEMDWGEYRSIFKNCCRSMDIYIGFWLWFEKR